jgi:hypothetical protein
MAVTSWTAGTRMTADRMNEMLPVWSAWTPTWSTSSGSATPSFGDATVDCKYAQVGDVVMFNLEITFGSTTNFGGGGTSDNWRFSLPVTASEAVFCCGFGEIQDSSVAGSLGRAGVRVRLTTTSVMELEISTGRPDGTAIANGGLIDAASPWTWANGDFIRVSGQYQAA